LYLCGANLVQVRNDKPMEKFKPTVSLFLDTRIEKKTGKYPLKLTIYCRPRKKRYNTNIDLTTIEWEKMNSERIRDPYIKKCKVEINIILTKAEKVIEALKPFSFKGFEDLFFESAVNLKALNLKDLFTVYAERHDLNGNVGTAISYRTSYTSLNTFKPNLTLHEISVDFLEGYEKYMLDSGKSVSTIGIYLRQLRAIYNDAISRKLISSDNYPFGKSKYKIPAGRNVKKALNEEDIKKLLSFQPLNPNEQKALDFWVFSYLCNGMNFCDIARLCYKDIQDQFIYYIRSKTRNTSKSNTKFIRVPLHPRAMAIIKKWGVEGSKEDYIFSVLTHGLSAKTIKHRVQDFIKNNNKHMRYVQHQLGISQPCNTYSCRHSFATVLKRKNVSTEFISESLGHASLQTTSAYLDSFTDETKIEFSKLLTNFG